MVYGYRRRESTAAVAIRQWVLGGRGSSEEEGQRVGQACLANCLVKYASVDR